MKHRLRPRTIGWGVAIAGGLLVALVLVTWKASSPLLFLLYPLLLLSVLALLAMSALWALGHY